jgi:hypothetical protein
MWITTYLNKEGKNGVDGYIRPKMAKNHPLQWKNESRES